MSDLINRIRHNYQSFYDLESGSYYGTGNDGMHYEYSAPASSYPLFDFMADQVGSERSSEWHKGKFPSSNCFHATVDMSTIGFIQDFATDGGTVHFESGQRGRLPIGEDLFFRMAGNPGYLVSDFGFRVPKVVRDNYSEEAFNYFSDVFPQSLSFGEFVQGFTQLKDLLPQLGESITKTISGGYLNKKFGWDNLLADLGTLGTLFKSTIARMEYFHRTYGVPQRLGFSRHVDSSYIHMDDAFYTYGRYGLYATGLRLKSVDILYRSTAWIYQVLEYVHDLAGFMRTLFGALGLNNPVKAFWNTIPLSFLVDWFFNISQHLDHLTRLNPAMGWNVNNMTHSITYDVVFTIFQCSSYANGGLTHFADYDVHAKYYERYVGLSFDWELLNPEELSPSQLSLLLAMLHQLS